MKKIFSIFLSVVFLISAMGVSFNGHFCGMKLQSISLTKQGCCCKGGAKMPKDCCKNESKYVKIVDDYSPAAQIHIENINVAPVFFNTPFPLAISHLTFSIPFKSHSPPSKFRDRVIAFRSILV